MPSKDFTICFDELPEMSPVQLGMLLARCLAAEALIRHLLANEPGPSAASPDSPIPFSLTSAASIGVGHK